MKKPIIWLCDSNRELSYARVVGSVCIFVNLVWELLIIFSDKDINSVYNLIANCSGFITGVLLWLIELFRDMKNISIKLGDKEYSVNK